MSDAGQNPTDEELKTKYAEITSNYWESQDADAYSKLSGRAADDGHLLALRAVYELGLSASNNALEEAKRMVKIAKSVMPELRGAEFEIQELRSQLATAKADGWDEGGKSRADWLWSMNPDNPKKVGYTPPPANPYRLSPVQEQPEPEKAQPDYGPAPDAAPGPWWNDIAGVARAAGLPVVAQEGTGK